MEIKRVPAGVMATATSRMRAKSAVTAEPHAACCGTALSLSAGAVLMLILPTSAISTLRHARPLQSGHSWHPYRQKSFLLLPMSGR